jgi:hypothetical protein
MLDRSKIGYEFPAFKVELEKGMLRLFARAIGEDNPVYVDEEAAIAAGYPSLPMSPTYPFCLGKFIDDPFDALHLFEVDFNSIVHGEQEFNYYVDVYAGDILHGQKHVCDIYEKNHGKLEFIVVKTEFTKEDNTLVCDATQTIVVKYNEHA